MKRALFVIVLFTAFAAAAFAQTADFDLIYKAALTNPVDTQRLEPVILKSLNHYGWRIVSNEDQKITAEYEKSGGKIRATIEVEFSEDGYTVKYVSSKNLDVDLEEMKIHRNYVRWIRNLMKTINKKYL